MIESITEFEVKNSSQKNTGTTQKKYNNHVP